MLPSTTNFVIQLCSSTQEPHLWNQMRDVGALTILADCIGCLEDYSDLWSLQINDVSKSELHSKSQILALCAVGSES